MELFMDSMKVIDWLDDKRWQLPKNYNFINYSRKELTPSEKILTHWISYITDRQMPFEMVWDKGGFVFSDMVWEYKRNKRDIDELIQLFYKKKPSKNGEKQKYTFESIVAGNDEKVVQFASRFITSDIKNIKKTLIILDRHNRSLVDFIIYFLDRFENNSDPLKRLACVLDLLTYQIGRKEDLMKNVEKTEQILETDFEKHYEKWKKRATKGKKRLWCSLRDYVKRGSTFNNEFLKALESKGKDYIKRWKRFQKRENMAQIELPGDVWNENPVFKEKFLINNISRLDQFIVVQSWKTPRLVRELYNYIKRLVGHPPFYPEQFDITFDFIPRMCKTRKLCHICPLGPNGSTSICSNGKTKYCPVALISCGYTIKCKNPKKCIIRNGTGKGACLGVDSK